ncbi:hypothetical protein DCO57_21935 [Labrenzia sp. 011]|nr:hypothetical protein DCO57_21935 [Labrenzia sp. 011]
MVPAVFLLLAACSNAVREFQIYSTAFDLQNETAQKVLDKIANAERAHWTVLNNGNDPARAFKPNDAAYYVIVGDPPLTASMRKTLAAAKAYNQALAGLANGESVDALMSRTTSIVNDLSAAQSDLSSAAGFAEIVTIPAVVPGYLGTAKQIFGTALKGAARESFRANLLRAFPTIKQILVTYRDGTPELYYFVISSPKAVSRQQMLKDRELFASWVLLIDQTIGAMEVAVKAARNQGSRANIDALADHAIELRILAEKVKTEQNR